MVPHSCILALPQTGGIPTKWNTTIPSYSCLYPLSALIKKAAGLASWRRDAYQEEAKKVEKGKKRKEKSHLLLVVFSIGLIGNVHTFMVIYPPAQRLEPPVVPLKSLDTKHRSLFNYHPNRRLLLPVLEPLTKLGMAINARPYFPVSSSANTKRILDSDPPLGITVRSPM